jgi:hypothetical protein
MKFIKIDKKTNGKTQQLELVISILCLLNGIHLSKTELNVLSYYITYKINSKTDNLLISSKIVKDISSLRNIKAKLKKLGFLKRTSELYKSYELNLSKDFDADTNDIRLLIKIDNS